MGETSDLDGEVLGHHAVPGGQVAVDELLGVEVGHAVGDLRRHLDHLLQRGRRAARVVLHTKQTNKQVRAKAAFSKSFRTTRLLCDNINHAFVFKDTKTA